MLYVLHLFDAKRIALFYYISRSFVSATFMEERVTQTWLTFDDIFVINALHCARARVDVCHDDLSFPQNFMLLAKTVFEERPKMKYLKKSKTQ